MALRTLLATVDETLPVLPASTHREVGTAHVLLPVCLGALFPAHTRLDAAGTVNAPISS